MMGNTSENLIATGLSDVDSALGGGLINGGNLLIAYDKRSMGWALGMRIFKSMIENGAVGVVFNTTLPLSKVELRAKYVGLDIKKEGEKGRLYIIDLFGSKYGIPEERPYVFQIKEWSDDTGIPKLLRTYRMINDQIPTGATVVGLVATVEGLYHEFGRDVMNRIIRASLASFESTALDRPFAIISLLNTEAVADYVTAWLYSLSDQIIEFISKVEASGLEEMALVSKSLIPGFEPHHYTVKLSKEHFIQLV
ncbi:hypothetical protein JCM16138_12520 [Thermococcus atlanticus]